MYFTSGFVIGQAFALVLIVYGLVFVTFQAKRLSGLSPEAR